MAFRSALFNEETLKRDLYRDVVDVVGQDNDIEDDREDIRERPLDLEGIMSPPTPPFTEKQSKPSPLVAFWRKAPFI